MRMEIQNHVQENGVTRGPHDTQKLPATSLSRRIIALPDAGRICVLCVKEYDFAEFRSPWHQHVIILKSIRLGIKERSNVNNGGFTVIGLLHGQLYGYQLPLQPSRYEIFC